MNEENKFKTIYINLQFYWIGGLWGYAVMQIQDTNDSIKIRLAKCKKKKNFPKTEKSQWNSVDVKEISNLSQVSKINFKTLEEFQACHDKIKEEFNSLS